jgi:glutamate dehydrogenase
MPFLVDSISMEISRHGRAIHLVIRPIMRVRRDAEGRLLEVGDGNPESLIHVELDRLDPQAADELRSDLQRVLRDVRAAVEDWRAMQERAREIAAELEEKPPPVFRRRARSAKRRTRSKPVYALELRAPEDERAPVFELLANFTVARRRTPQQPARTITTL